MGCGCGGGSANADKFEVVAPDGSVTSVKTHAEAVSLAKRTKGTWRLKKA